MSDPSAISLVILIFSRLNLFSQVLLISGVVIYSLPVICLITRAVTGIRAYIYNSKTQSNVRRAPLKPYWIPWTGQFFSFDRPAAGRLYATYIETRSGIFAALGFGRRYHVIVSPTLRDQVLKRSDSHLSNSTMMFSLLKNFIGDRGGTEMLVRRSTNVDYWKKYCETFAALNRAPFVDAVLKGTVRAVESQTWNLVSGNDSWVDQEMWERNAQVTVLPPEHHSNNSSFVAEANLHSLLCEWTGQMVTSQLMGHAFTQANPRAVSDILLMDSKRTTFSSPLPIFLLPNLLSALHARERLIRAITEWQDAMVKVINGQDPGTTYDDLSNIPQAVWDQMKLQREAGANSRMIAATTLISLWSLVTDTTQLVFWLVFYIASNKELLSRVREEISPFVQVAAPPDTGLAITESPRLKINADGLLSKCNHLRGALYEVLRLENSPYIHMHVTKDFTITESEKDAQISGKRIRNSYMLRSGDRLIVPGSVHQHDPNWFPNHQNFYPKRFWNRDVEKHETGQPHVQMNTMKPWGRGNNIFEFGNVVEKQVLVYVAAFVAVWDVEPADKTLFNPFRGWAHPGRISSVGVARPRKDIKVKIWRRANA